MSVRCPIVALMCALFISGGVVSAPRNADLDDLRAAAEKGNPAAANAYAEVLVELHRFADSLPWFEVAADAGITNAQWRLGHMYLRGIRAAGSQNVAERPADGFRWLQHAALQGHKHAQLDLGRAYHEGFGTAKNAHEALFWFCIAAEHGLVRARESRDKLMFALPPCRSPGREAARARIPPSRAGRQVSVMGRNKGQRHLRSGRQATRNRQWPNACARRTTERQNRRPHHAPSLR